MKRVEYLEGSNSRSARALLERRGERAGGEEVDCLNLVVRSVCATYASWVSVPSGLVLQLLLQKAYALNETLMRPIFIQLSVARHRDDFWTIFSCTLRSDSPYSGP